MKIQRLPLEQAAGHLLIHNVVDATGKRALRKGVQLAPAHLARLAELGYRELDVAVLAPDDIPEDEAASRLVEAVRSQQLMVKRGVGGRANLHTTVRGLLKVDAERLAALNNLPGITLATLPQHALVYPSHDPLRRGHDDQVATLKIIPYALPANTLCAALEIAHGAPIIDLLPLREQRVALLITGDATVHASLRAQFEPAIRQRLERLGSQLVTVCTVVHDEAAIGLAAQPLLNQYDLLIVAGQTSIMDEHDLVLAGLYRQGARIILHGAPVDPGNLLALAEYQGRPILCAPGCARSMAPNVVDLILPRLLTGQLLTRTDLNQLAVGGLLR
jgi:hypothetical protein